MLRSDAAPVAVFDLDGTILSVNSFPRWVLFLIAGRPDGLGFRRRMALSWRSFSLLMRRKLAGGSHDDFLRSLQSAWRSSCPPSGSAECGSRFETHLLRLVRSNLTSVLALVANGSIDAVLATAAAEDYATGLACRLGFRHVLATASARAEHAPCNKGAHKRERVLALLDAQGWRHRPLILFTDHIDDLPLIRDSALVCWYGPAGKMMQAAEDAPNTSFVFCRDLSAAEIVAGLQDGQIPASALL